MHRVVFSARANTDLDRLHAFIAVKSPRAARCAVERIIEGIDLLSLFPQSGTLVRGNIRNFTIRFGRSGYIVRYELQGEDVLITRIWHGKEDRPR